MDRGKNTGFPAKACFAWLLLLGMSLLSACGGGGGGGGGGAGRDFSLSTNAVSFSAPQGAAAPAAKVVAVTVNSGTVFVKTSQTGTSFGHTFQITGPTTGEITITPGVTFNAGAFTGTIEVHGCSDAFCLNDIGGSPQTISVSYTVTGLGVTPTALDFASNVGGTPASQNVTLALTPGGSDTWTSSINYTGGAATNWLTLTPSNGALSPSRVVSVGVTGPTATPELRTATITFSNTSGTLTQNVAVTYTISSPMVNFVAPYVVPAGAGGNVILRGHGFSSLNAGATTVQFGAQPGAAATVVSDTEIHATYPSLTAGTYTVTVTDGTPLATRTGVKFVAVDPLTFPAAAAAIARTNSPFTPTDLVYDAERQALYLIDSQANRLESYQFNGATWQANTLQFHDSGGGNRHIALSPDGTLLMKMAVTGSVLTRFDLTNNFTELPADDASSLGNEDLNGMAFANDGRAVGQASGVATLYRYDMLTRQFFPLSADFNFVNRTIAASADGDTLVLTSPVGSTGQDVVTIDGSDGTVTHRTVQSSTNCCISNLLSVSRNGSRIVLVTPPAFFGGPERVSVFDASFDKLGDIATGATGAVVSPDGSTVYAYFPGSTSVRKFDLTAPTVGGVFPETGSATITSPGTSFTAMTISPDATALFLAGTAAVVVLQAP